MEILLVIIIITILAVVREINNPAKSQLEEETSSDVLFSQSERSEISKKLRTAKFRKKKRIEMADKG